ncbi:MAG: Lrp/AsnC family transcriptional regulator [Thermoplasmatales archaeon]|nr:MAG: Lrp/AsnC family transcriptional regulator [Thermoplasmatales archaeon]
MKLDLKDRKILYQLDRNARQSYSSIGKKVGLHRSNVIHRIEKLKKEGIIFNFLTYVDISKLGYNVNRFYFILQYQTPDIKNNIIKDLIENKYSLFVTKNEGQIDLSVYFAIKNVYEFYKEWSSFYSKYRNYFSKIFYSQWCFEYEYPYSFLLYDTPENRSDVENIRTFGGGPIIKIDDLDLKILRILTIDSRIPTSEIAQKLHSTANTISKRIRDLQNTGVIKGFYVDLHFTKLDYKMIRVDISLRDYKKMNRINEYIIKNQFVRCRYISIGDAADLEYEIFFKNINELNIMMEDLIRKFPDTIRNYRYHRGLERLKNKFVPDY